MPVNASASGDRGTAARLLAASLATVLLLLGSALSSAGQRPNILLLVAEDLGPRIGAFGDPLAHTPNIDALARGGVRYTRTFTTAGVCAPSRAALITGVHQNTLGAGHMRSNNWAQAKYMAVPPPQLKAFPELLRAAGYFTYVNAKLDYQFSGQLPGSGPFTMWDNGSARALGASWRDRFDARPFFGMYAFTETHESGLFPRCCWPRSALHALLAVLQTVKHWQTGNVVQPEQVKVPPYYPDVPEIRADIAQQYNNAITMDRQVGVVLEQLERDGLADSTIVIWTSDHGDGLPRAKRELYDSGIQVPMVIYWPERFRPAHIQPGMIDARLISFVDLAPTILALGGAAIPDYIDGRPFAGETQSPPRQYIYAAADRMDEALDRQRAVRDARFKYIHNDYTDRAGAKHLAFRDTLESMRVLWRMHEAGQLTETQSQWFAPHPREELYDTLTDPHEVNNLASDPAYAQTLTRMRAALAEWRARTPDLGALPEAELAEKSWPQGIQPKTAVPVMTLQGTDGAAKNMQIAVSTPGASLGYRLNDGPWLLYQQPVAVRPGDTLVAKAVRYGWAESDEAQVTIP